MLSTDSEVIAFGPFRLFPRARQLLRGEEPVALGGRALDILVALARQPGRVVGKRELLAQVWPNSIVEDGSLRFHMTNLRRALGDGADGKRYIATQVGVGYAFVAEVHDAQTGTSERALSDSPGALPPRIRMIGRECDLRIVLAALENPGLLTVAGPGGVGKTTLAVEAAHLLALAGGQRLHFVDLAQISDPSLLASALAGALGVRIQGEDPLEALIASLRGRSPFILIDNCEHLIAAVATALGRLLAELPGATLLATSREPIRVHGERICWLGPLALPNEADEDVRGFSAVQLFIERATALNLSLVFDVSDLQLIADICRRIDGMALPIELVAARVATHGLAETHRLLGEHHSLGWTGLRTASSRHRTLKAMLDWSYALLPEEDAIALERLSVIVGPFDYRAASRLILGAEGERSDAAARVDALAEKGLIATNGAGTMPFRLLEMTRAYARDKLHARGSTKVAETCRRHAQNCLAMLSTICRSEETGIVVDEALTGQLGNVRAALEWSFGPQGDQRLGCRLAAASLPLFMHASLLREARTWSERAIGELGDDQRGSELELDLQAGRGLALMFTRANNAEVERSLLRALELAGTLELRWRELRILGFLQIFHERLGDFHQSADWSRRALDVADVIDEPEARAVAASLFGVALHLLGNQDAAREQLETALRLARRSSYARTILYGFDHRNRSGIALARVLWLQGETAAAQALVREVEAEADALDHPVTHCIALIWTLTVHGWANDIEAADESLDKLRRRAETNGFGPYLSAVDGLEGSLAIRQGQPKQGLGLIRASLADLGAARYELLTTSLEIALIEGLEISDRPHEALATVKRTIARCQNNGDGFALPELLRAKANIIRALGGDESEIEAIRRDGIELARRQGAIAWELRLVLDLAGQCIDTGRPGEAAQLLHSWKAGPRHVHDPALEAEIDRLLQMAFAAA